MKLSFKRKGICKMHLLKMSIVAGFLFALASLISGCAPALTMYPSQGKESVVVERDIVIHAARDLKLDVYRPDSPATDRPIIVYFYGGFWQFGGKDELQNQVFANGLAQRGAIVVTPEYRLYPETAFPGFLEDGAAAVAWAVQHARELGGNPEKIYVAGHSAGAYIAVMLAADEKYLAQRGLNSQSLAGVIGISGPYGEWFLDHVTVSGIFDKSRPEDTLPWHHITQKTPPLLLLSGSWDVFTNPSDTINLARYARERGAQATDILYPMIGHLGIMMSFPWLPSLAPVANDIAYFIRGHQPYQMTHNVRSR
jgi:acetyl esterase/lipase